MRKNTDTMSLTRDVKFLKAVFGLGLIFSILALFSLMRLIGVEGLPSILLVTYRVVDLILIACYLYYFGITIKFRSEDSLLALWIAYPLLIGIYNGQVSMTLFNDVAIFTLFALKVVILRTFFSRILVVEGIGRVLVPVLKKFVFWSATIAIVLLVLVTISTRSFVFYFQAPAEITFAAALMLSSGRSLHYLGFFILALMSGKRMIMVGSLAMLSFAAFVTSRGVKTLFLVLILGFMLSAMLLMVASPESIHNNPSFNKIISTFNLLVNSKSDGFNLDYFLLSVAPARYLEYISLKPYLDGWPLLLGNGFGFRYFADYFALQEFGLRLDSDMTNAHFTPLAIIVKQGLLGLLIWFFLIGKWLFARTPASSTIQLAGKLALVSMLVQSFFAFGFFTNYFTPIYIALVTAQLNDIRRRKI